MVLLNFQQLLEKKSTECICNSFWLPFSLFIRDCICSVRRNFPALCFIILHACSFCWLQAGRLRGRVRVPVGARIFTSACHPDRLWGPPSLLSNWYQRLFHQGVKKPWREADHSPPTRAKVKKMWVYTSTPPYVFMV
jgi:hypothetical protein